MKTSARFSLSTTQIIMLSFLLVILVGSVLLSLPVSAASGNAIPYLDALFTATTATCVTGLVTVPIALTFSTFGQIIILLLIQIGGLGVITVMSGVLLALHRKIGLGDRLLIQDAFNLNTMSGLTVFIRKVIVGTLAIEAAGALLCMPVFVRDFGVRGVWISVFHSISAFCNAGIDVISENSLCGYATDPLINTVTCLLIVLGGLGYIVWWDVLRVLHQARLSPCQRFRRLTLHSKLAIVMTLCLILLGGALFLLFEYNNPLTIGNDSLFDKIQAALFQSITTRTAGFASVPQQDLTDASSLTSLLLMFIGGSPVGTAGGIKTVTVAVLIASAVATLKNKNAPSLFGRTLSSQALHKAVAITLVSFGIVFISTLSLMAVTDAAALDVLYETVSATATVGLSRDLTPHLNTAGKWIVAVTMYLGRVGPISLLIAFNTKKVSQNIVKDPAEDISVG